MIKKQITKEKAEERLASLCSRSEQCEYDLNHKMINWGIKKDERNEIIEKLKENRYLDEKRFARSFANDKSKFSSWGPYKIKIELIKKRISLSVITEVLKDIGQDIWKEGLKRNLISKSKNLDLNDKEEGYTNCQKVYRYLISRGFPSNVCSRAVMKMKKLQQEEYDKEND